MAQVALRKIVKTFDRTLLFYVSVVEGGRQNITLSTMIALARVTGHEVRVVLRRVRRQPE
jgi:hypothetical protein